MSVHVLRQKFEAFVNNMNVNIALAVEGVEQQLTDLNKANLLNSKDKFDKPLKHNKTGSTTLSSAYARLKNKLTPDLFDKGDYQSEMFLTVDENANQYHIQSNDSKHVFLTENYNDIMGVATSKQQKAKEITSKAIGQLLKSKIQ